MFSTQGNIWCALGNGAPRGVQAPTKFRRPSKIVPNPTRLWKLLKIAEFRMPTPQDIRKKGSKILKLPPVRNCFTLATTNKLVVIVNSLKVPTIKKPLLYEMKFLVPNYSCLQNLWIGGYRPQIPILSVLNWISRTPPLEQNSWVRHWLFNNYALLINEHCRSTQSPGDWILHGGDWNLRVRGMELTAS